MDSNKTLSTIERQKQRKTEAIINSGIDLFCKKGIERVKMEEIATNAGVGVATVYRYFNTKAQLSVKCAIYIWKNESEKYMWEIKKDTYRNQNGYEQVTKILDILFRLFKNSPQFFVFLKEFDAYVQASNMPKELLVEYEEGLLALKPYFTSALEKGIKDGTIRLNSTVEETYFAIMHTLLSLMQKLSSAGQLLESDGLVNDNTEVSIIINLLLAGLKA